MPPIDRSAPNFSRPTLWLALGLCIVLAAGRSVSGWGMLSALQLPDPDDAMRLVQIRDWLGGQGFFDLTQYRLGGADGTPMHWSRLGDIGPAAIMLAARPLFGAHGAELAALILWPSLLFLAFMLLSAGIARQLGGDRATGVAVILAALAFPAAAMFAPGRIDHHGLQLVLLLVALRHSVGNVCRRSGVIAGAAMAASMAVGVEMVVPLALLCGFACARWVNDGARAHLFGISLGLLGGLAVMAILAPFNWTYPACDAFTRQAASAALCGGVALGVLAHIPVALDRRGRTIAVIGVGIATLCLTALLAPACLADPYAGVDPVVRSAWMSRVEEARGLMALSPTEWVGIAGLPLVGLVAAIAQTARHRCVDWMLLLLLVLGSVVLSLVQTRAIHVAAALAPAVLAPILADLRAVRPALAPIGWLLSIGISYPLAAKAMPSPDVAIVPGCDASQAIRGLAQRPPGVVLAPIDIGPQLLVETRQRVLAAPYHRNASGIRAWIDGASDPLRAEKTGADTLVLCHPGDRGAASLVSLGPKE